MAGVIVNILWIAFCIRPVYSWMDNHFDNIQFDSTKSLYDICAGYDIIGKGYWAMLNGIILTLPVIIVAFIVPQIIYPNSPSIYGILVFMAILLPIFLLFSREDVFNMKVKQIEEDGMVINESFYCGKYPANFTGIALLPMVWCCIIFGFGNYYTKHYFIKMEFGSNAGLYMAC